MSGRTLENAIIRLLKKRPFYGYLLADLRKGSGTALHPVGITIHAGVPTLTANDALLGTYSPEQQEALLEHCVLHMLHLHPLRRKERNRHDWDIASDLALNPAVENMPRTAPFPEYFSLPDGLAAEDYYQKLVDPFDTGNLKGAGAGSAEMDDTGLSGKDQGESDCTPLDDHAIWEEADSTPLRLAEEMVRSMAREAMEKCDGNLPGELRPLVAALLAPPRIPWKMILRQFLATAGRVGRKSTWQRENRRFEHGTPGCRKRHRLNLLVGIDVSDSTDKPEIREAFAAELVRIAQGADTFITVLYANSLIQRIDSFHGSSVAVSSYHGGGFTDLRPVFEYARKMQPRPAGVIYLTDGIGPAPEKMEFPTLWVLTAEGEKPVPWGVELKLDI
jgi:predicted metal-dependent peptidase